MNLPILRTDLQRRSPFSFLCNRCLSCCRHKKIQLNPYEVARLAANKGISTGEFIDRWTREAGTVLNWNEDGTCVFLNAGGCGVHPDRPLVCRLYPLGRHVNITGAENFSEIERSPECRGLSGEDGGIADYLEVQGARPFMAAADRYLELFWRLYFILEEKAGNPSRKAAIVDVLRNAAAGIRPDIGLQDMDAIVSAFCEKTGAPLPPDIDGKMSVHIAAVEAWANYTKKEGLS